MPTTSIPRQLGVIGLQSVEPVILAALANRDPLLLIGPHGCGKSWLLNLIAGALGIEHRHYNASLLNFDDLVGYSLPDSNGQLRFIQTPASIWGAQAVFIDEISRCRPEIQNKLFSILHERRVQGLPLERLEHRWSAMNPPAGEDEGSAAYAGSEPLDHALVDRFAFILEIPGWEGFSEHDQLDLIKTANGEPAAGAAASLARILPAVRSLASSIRTVHGAGLARYIRLVCILLRQAELAISGRRAVQLRNISAVHAVRELAHPAASFADSALLALAHSLPQRATGEKIPAHKILPAHREAWKAAGNGAFEPDRRTAGRTGPDPPDDAGDSHPQTQKVGVFGDNHRLPHAVARWRTPRARGGTVRIGQRRTAGRGGCIAVRRMVRADCRSA